MVDPKSQSLNINGVGREGDGGKEEGPESTFSIYSMSALGSLAQYKNRWDRPSDLDVITAA